MGCWTTSSAPNHWERSQKSNCQALGTANTDVQPVRLPRAICVHKLVQPVTCFTFKNLNNHKHRHFFSFSICSRTHQGGMVKEFVGGRKFGGCSFFQWMFLCTLGFFSVPERIGVLHTLPEEDKAHEDTSYRITHCCLFTVQLMLLSLPQSSLLYGKSVVGWAL